MRLRDKQQPQRNHRNSAVIFSSIYDSSFMTRKKNWQISISINSAYLQGFRTLLNKSSQTGGVANLNIHNDIELHTYKRTSDLSRKENCFLKSVKGDQTTCCHIEAKSGSCQLSKAGKQAASSWCTQRHQEMSLTELQPAVRRPKTFLFLPSLYFFLLFEMIQPLKNTVLHHPIMLAQARIAVTSFAFSFDSKVLAESSR